MRILFEVLSTNQKLSNGSIPPNIVSKDPKRLKITDKPHPLPAEVLDVGSGLILKLPDENDAVELFRKIDSNRDYLREWLPWLDDVITVEDELEAIRSRPSLLDSCMYAILLDGKIVGTAGINSFDWENRMFTIGYWLSEDLTGQGIVTKCCSRLIDHCFEDLGHHRACILVAVENFPSRAVPSRLGMRLEGISKDREWLYDHYVDAAVYAITKPDWRPIGD